MSYEQAFAAYCIALQSLIDAGATVSMSILSHLWWIQYVHFDGHIVTVEGVDSITKEPRLFSWRADYVNFSVHYPPWHSR